MLIVYDTESRRWYWASDQPKKLGAKGREIKTVSLVTLHVYIYTYFCIEREKISYTKSALVKMI